MRKQINPIAFFALASLVLAAAAYAPHSSTLATTARNTAYLAPCSATVPWKPAEPATAQADPYPVPSEDVIARGHSGESAN